MFWKMENGGKDVFCDTWTTCHDFVTILLWKFIMKSHLDVEMFTFNSNLIQANKIFQFSSALINNNFCWSYFTSKNNCIFYNIMSIHLIKLHIMRPNINWLLADKSWKRLLECHTNFINNSTLICYFWQ